MSLNNTNISCAFSISWSQWNIDSQRPRLIACLIASIIHFIFWFPIIFHAPLRQKSLQWIYAYLVADILLLFRFFFVYIAHITSIECQANQIWFFFIYYFEATVDNYLNLLKVYIILALNICRYVQIAYNRDVYRTKQQLLIATHISIYMIPLLIYFVQFFKGWVQLELLPNGVSDVIYTNIYVQIYNIITAFVLPIFLNILVIYASIRHVRLTSNLQRAQHRICAREKYNRSLIIQFLVFYSIWVSFWSPNVIAFQVMIGSNYLTTIVRLLNFIEIALDPFIIGALDVRFWQTWRKIERYSKKKFFRNEQRQVQPIVTIPIRQRMNKQNGTA